MRQIEVEMLEAIRERRNWQKDNTGVEVSNDKKFAYVYLFGNCICKIDYDQNLRYYKTCGWNTVTTKSRLAALGCNCRIKSGNIVDCNSNERLPKYDFE